MHDIQRNRVRSRVIGAGSPLGDGELAAFESGNLELDFPQMTVTQEGTETPIIYSGPGSLRQTPDRRLKFRLFCTTPSSTPRFAETIAGDGLHTAGQLVAADCFYSLSAIDLTGQQWSSERLMVDRDEGSAGLVITGKLNWIEHNPRADLKATAFRLIVIAEVEFPANRATHTKETSGEEWSEESRRDVAEFEACGRRIRLRRHPGKLVITVEKADAALPPYSHTRIIEGLQFVLGRSLWWSAMIAGDEHTQTLRLRSERGQPQLRLKAPIALQQDLLGEATWPLCTKYLAFIWNYGLERFHPISAWLDSARHASTGSVFAKGLALAVAVEGVLNSELEAWGAPNADYLEGIAAARAHMACFDGDSELKKRIDKAIEPMARARAKDRLRALESVSVVTKAQISAWDKLRNSTAHARPPEDQQLQEWLDLCHATEVLLYRLIFFVIRYAGPYTDYAARGWPTTTFQLPSATAG